MKVKVKFGILLLSLTLSGCGGIPISSEVYFGEVVSEDITAQFVRVIARPPSEGMTPETIVRGFLDACADPAQDYGIARQYLVPESASAWNPDTGIEIYDVSTMQISGEAPNLVAVAAKKGDITDLGKYASANPGAQTSSNFELIQDELGQWRISKLSNGILLSSGDVDRSFRSFPIYFFNSALTSLVSDSLLVPVSKSGAATSLVLSLLAGPSPYLAPVAVTAFPVGTKLTYGSVPVVNGVAQVDLTKEILGADEVTRRALSAQLVWTLSVLPNVSGVQISVSGQPFVLSDIGAIQTVSDWQRSSPLPNESLRTLNVIRKEKIFTIGGESDEVRATAQTALLSGSASQNSLRIAVVTSDLKSLLVSESDSTEFTVLAQGEVISRPSWDNSGRIFYADFGQGVTEISEDGSIRNVLADVSVLGNTQQIKKIAIAGDGVRVAVVYSDGVSDVLAVGAIFRTETETRIIGLHRVEQDITQVTDIAWSTPTSIAALGSDQLGSELFFTISLNDGKVSTRSLPVGALTMAVDGAGNIFVGAVDGAKQVIYQKRVALWSEVTQGSGMFFTR
ncbi:MAG: LpqB family beta-propeller domain-containing protein [Actinomycetes bacterium]